MITLKDKITTEERKAMIIATNETRDCIWNLINMLTIRDTIDVKSVANEIYSAATYLNDMRNAIYRCASP